MKAIAHQLPVHISNIKNSWVVTRAIVHQLAFRPHDKQHCCSEKRAENNVVKRTFDVVPFRKPRA